MTTTCVLDSFVHRTAKIGTPMTPHGFMPTVTFQQPDPSVDPVLEFDFGGGNVVNIVCDGSVGIKPPTKRDCHIKSKGSPLQFSCDIDDTQEWLLIVGAELSTDADHSVCIVNKTDLSTGTNSDFIMYSANATATTAAVKAMEIPTGGGGLKVPPTVGVEMVEDVNPREPRQEHRKSHHHDRQGK